jgi:hypothetical protein
VAHGDTSAGTGTLSQAPDAAVGRPPSPRLDCEPPALAAVAVDDNHPRLARQAPSLSFYPNAEPGGSTHPKAPSEHLVPVVEDQGINETNAEAQVPC